MREPITIRRLRMPTAFVLINTETGLVRDVLKNLKKVEGVDEAFIIYGVYDIIAKISAKSMDQLNEIVTRHIRKIGKVRQTLTMTVIQELE
jgi:DNA-binding Lrp family transcriptional regulator